MGTVRKVMHGPCPSRIQVIRYKIEAMQIIQRIEISRVLQKKTTPDHWLYLAVVFFASHHWNGVSTLGYCKRTNTHTS